MKFDQTSETWFPKELPEFFTLGNSASLVTFLGVVMVSEFTWTFFSEVWVLMVTLQRLGIKFAHGLNHHLVEI